MVQAVQMLFEQSQASFDPNTIMALLQEHPYHVDALLAMHELYRFASCKLCYMGINLSCLPIACTALSVL